MANQLGPTAVAEALKRAGSQGPKPHPTTLGKEAAATLAELRAGTFRFTPAECDALFDTGTSRKRGGRAESEELSQTIARFRERAKVTVVDLPHCEVPSASAHSSLVWNACLFLSQAGFEVSTEQWYGGFRVDALGVKDRDTPREKLAVVEVGDNSCAKLAELLTKPARPDVEVGVLVVPYGFVGRHALLFHPVREHGLVVASSANVPERADPASSYLARLSASSRRTQRGAIERIVFAMGGTDPRTFPWHQVTYQHVRGFLVRIEKEGLALATLNRIIAAFKGVLQEARRLKLMSAEDMLAAADALKPKRGERVAKGRMLSEEELSKLLEDCVSDGKAYGKRDAAMLTLLRFGLRRHEVTGARVADFDADQRTLRVLGKGNKEREVAFTAGAARYIQLWLKARPPGGDTILTPLNKARALTPQAVVEVLKKRAKRAELDGASFSSHDFRRTFISGLLDAGVDISTAQKLAGHGDPATTARYDRRDVRAKKAAVEKLKWGSAVEDSEDNDDAGEHA